MMDYIAFDTLTAGFIAMALIVRAAIVHSVREEAIHIMRFDSLLRSNEHNVITRYESFGSFWSMYFDLHKWLFNQFYPGVSE